MSQSRFERFENDFMLLRGPGIIVTYDNMHLYIIHGVNPASLQYQQLVIVPILLQDVQDYIGVSDRRLLLHSRLQFRI